MKMDKIVAEAKGIKIEIEPTEVEVDGFWLSSIEDLMEDLKTDLQYALRKFLPKDSEGEPVKLIFKVPDKIAVA